MSAKPQPLARPRAVLYLRQSTFREESISLELQEAAGRAHAEKNGYDVIDVLADPGISGRTWKRPAVQKVMDMLERHEADVVVLWRWSRLSRSRRDWAVAADRADLAGGRIESATEPNDRTAAGRFARGVMTELAAFESERIGEQWKEAQERRRRLGLPSSGGARFGYDIDENGRYVPGTQAELLGDMYRRYIAGEGFTRIAASLNERGETTTRGNPFRRITIRQILDSGFGAGKIIHRPGRSLPRPKDTTYYDGAHEPVITADEWAAYLERRAEAPDAPTVVEPKYMLAGLIFCGECGAPMHVGNRGLVDYKCSGKAQGVERRGMVMGRALVERRVKEWVFELAEDIDALAAAEKAAHATQVRAVNSRTAIESRIRKLESRLAFITVQWADGEMLKEAYDLTAAAINTELQSLRARQVHDDTVAHREIDVRNMAIRLAEMWDDLTTFELRNLLRAIVARVEIGRPSRPGAGVWRERVTVVPRWVRGE